MNRPNLSELPAINRVRVLAGYLWNNQDRVPRQVLDVDAEEALHAATHNRIAFVDAATPLFDPSIAAQSPHIAAASLEVRDS